MSNPTTQLLSKFLTLQDSIKARPGFNNIPSQAELENIKAWGAKIYDPIVDHFINPPFIHSVFRNESYNKAIGGDPNSQHRFGQAGDLDYDNVSKAVTNKMLFDWIVRNLEFDEIIWEKGTSDNPDWVHVSYVSGNNRKRIKRCLVQDGKTIYIPFDLYKFPA